MRNLFVLIFFLMSAIPVFANTNQSVANEDDNAVTESLYNEEASADREVFAQDLLEDKTVSEEGIVESEEPEFPRRRFVPCRVFAFDRFGHVIGRFFAFRPRFNRICVRGFRLCRFRMARFNRPFFCRQVFVPRFPRDDD